MRPRGEVVALRQRRVREPLVVAQVEIGLRAVIGHEDFAVLERAHRAGSTFRYGSNFWQRDLQSAALQQAADRGGRDPLPREETTPPVTKINLAISHSL